LAQVVLCVKNSNNLRQPIWGDALPQNIASRSVQEIVLPL
jgi:hypothetical protein